jgi:hypothetical protein
MIGNESDGVLITKEKKKRYYIDALGLKIPILISSINQDIEWIFPR